MHSLTGQLAAVMASTDAVPRLVRDVAALFLVTPQGDVWRIFDSDDLNGERRFSPASDPDAKTRIFIGSGARPASRLYAFKPEEPRSASADRLYEQLLAARTVVIS